MGNHILAPEVIEKRAVPCTCPDCGKRTRILTYTYEWFGPDGTCIRCGRSFNEDGWVALPFIRGSRAKEIAKAKERFRRTKAVSIDAFLARISADKGAV